MTIFLTSTSARRIALLKQIGFRQYSDFRTAEIRVGPLYNRKEDRLTLTQARDRVRETAWLKVKQAVSGGYLKDQGLAPKETVLVGAETVLFLNDRLLPPPLSIDMQAASLEQIQAAAERSRSLLEMIRGQEIKILTGLTVAQAETLSNHRSICVTTRVKMKQYNDRDIDEYVATREGLPLAGGIDLHEKGVVLCEKIVGSFSNIGGLPLVELIDLLRDPLFANRVQFRLAEPDTGKYSLAVEEGPRQIKVISLNDVIPDMNTTWTKIELGHVLLVPGKGLLDEQKRESRLQIMARARRAGKLVVLDACTDVEEVWGRQTFLELVKNNVDVLVAEEITTSRLTQLMAPRLLLASQSPRRRELLRQIVAANQIEVLVSKQDEPYLDEKPGERVKRLALEKARAVYKRRDEYSPSIKIVIGADTEVVLGDEALGKPAGEEEARQQLQRLQGATHQVITGIAFIGTHSGAEFVDCVSTQVKFKELTGAEIETYIASGEPFGKAGAYGIQSKGALFVDKIDGSYSNVVGLPLERLSEIMDEEFGLPVWRLDAVSALERWL